ncbi:sensor histidine kinase [Paenibacillus arenilitoris]|uniref:sensor histidine kinase n=1 Tax=Paenibacillus arenilitoris TaxID=2772299 RepID=UPI00295ACCFE|nr:sensor histidine kinase [Paenibacillus arenilitoris]
MRSFWLWFGLLIAAWLGSMLRIAPEGAELAWRLLLSALSLTAFFLSPICREKPVALTVLLSASALLGAAALWPPAGGPFNPYPLLVFTVLAGKAVYRLPAKMAAVAGAAALAGAAGHGLAGSSGLPLPFIGLYALLLAIALSVFAVLSAEREAAVARYEALLSEYRMLKRRLISDEEAARQEERAHVGREIHDSVGHRLTALLMQLEVYRMQSGEQAQEMLLKLKELAKESLDETRNAVKALKQQETGGLPAILSLIRRLEAESFMRIHFTVKDGALSAPLSNAQSIAVYRAVQEALTNAMRHGQSREAKIMFEAPGGGSVFRFEVVNLRTGGKPFKEGFGLRSMRERLEQAGGQLEVEAYDNRFVICGTVSLRMGTGEET